jgi:membrane protease subunit HflC
LGAVALVAFLLANSLFIVQQTQQALVVRLGAVRSEIREPGLYFKVPFIETVITIDNRILDLDLPAQEILASDQNRLVVDAFSRFRVVNPLRFYQAVNSIAGAQGRLFPIASSAVRNVLADASSAAIIRTDRAALMNRIQDEVNKQARGFGIEIIDIRLTRVDLPDQNSAQVYERMRSEREREAADLRANGQQQAATIRARADRDVAVILGEANRRAEEVRGTGDAERTRLLAEAHARDPDFFSFFRSMQAYETALKSGDTRMVLSPDSPFFRYFTDPAGGGRAAAPRP